MILKFSKAFLVAVMIMNDILWYILSFKYIPHTKKFKMEILGDLTHVISNFYNSEMLRVNKNI